MTPSAGQSVEPSTLPQGIGSFSLAYLLFVTADIMTFWELIGHRLSSIVVPIMKVSEQTYSSDPFLGIGVGSAIGLVNAFFYLNFPLGFMDGRLPLAISAIRSLTWSIIIVHPFLMGYIVFNAFIIHNNWHGHIPLMALIGIPATPFLYFLIRPILTMRWLDLKSAPESWEKLVGIDGHGKKTIKERGGLPSGPAFSILMTPFACYRARMFGLAAISGLLWFGAIMLLLIDPVRALIPLVASSVIGRKVALASVRTPDQKNRMSAVDRLSRLQAIFTADRLEPPPRFLAVGLLSILFILPVEFQAAWFGLYMRNNNSAGAVLNTPLAPGLVAIVASGVIGSVIAFVTPMGFRFGILWYRLFGAIIVVLHIALLLVFWNLLPMALGYMSGDASPILHFVAIVLTVVSPFVIAVAISLPAAGKLPNLVKPHSVGSVS